MTLLLVYFLLIIFRYMRRILHRFRLSKEETVSGAFAAVSEVIVCMMSPLVMVVQGARAAVLVFFYFQYVARRHAESYWTQQAVKALTDKADGERAPRCVRSRLSPAPCNFGLVPVLA